MGDIQVYVEEETLILIFNKLAGLLVMQPVNSLYEGNELKGGLKGFNMPLKFLVENNRDSQISAIIEDLPESVIYVIGAVKGDWSTLLHEWSHSRYFRLESYASLCLDYWNSLNKKTKKCIEKDLEMRNYLSSNYVDEFQAYVLENPCEFGKRFRGELIEIHMDLKAIVKMPLLKP